LTPEFAFSLGQAVGLWLGEPIEGKRVVLGGDTRRSTPMLASALEAGLCSAGTHVVDLGVVPTPTVSFVTRTGDFALGAIVSASHNPAPDNGIKFVGHDGRKLDDEAEEQIESLLESPFERPTGGGVGSIVRSTEKIEDYLHYLEGILPERLDGWHIALDAANGAAFELGPEILKQLGATVTATGVEPNGVNINAEGGATKPDTICSLTVESGASIGVAFDGDADRAVFSDEKGRLLNGDRIMGIWAAHRKARGALLPPKIVGTVMSNGGFEKHLCSEGIELLRAPVGDKYVAQQMAEAGALIGGEQSGHIIFPHRGPTGDGLITMLELFRVLRSEDRPASSYFDAYEPWPQLLVNVGVGSTTGWKELMGEELAAAEAVLAGRGRLVVRASGTQPMIRVMVEADDAAVRDRVTDRLVEEMIDKLGGHVHGRVDLTYALGD
jgi:phosphoglucosamine mutase